jgi:hypothetical protein
MFDRSFEVEFKKIKMKILLINETKAAEFLEKLEKLMWEYQIDIKYDNVHMMPLDHGFITITEDLRQSVKKWNHAATTINECKEKYNK